jgi:hypothetical protein
MIPKDPPGVAQFSLTPIVPLFGFLVCASEEEEKVPKIVRSFRRADAGVRSSHRAPIGVWVWRGGVAAST